MEDGHSFSALPPISLGARLIRRWWRGLRPKRRVGAGVAVVRGEEVLLVRRGDNALWDVPGGGADAGEMPEDTARRELREETGLSVGPVRALGVFPHRYTYQDGNVVDWETHVFVAGFAGGEVRASYDATEVRWWPLSALPDDVPEATRGYFAALTAVRA
ncbi:NUDIX domain-containing protein [Deinococcus xianganensis]|uniref:NUDIX domain-containing protein n=1 Tax=Deinococcus xianganensis TaxID=1507289 RepID=A0A6I4YM35_9DEIO|nr:NUDIX domain-containing protein [Deinococcus xianganensis]MXV21061.1 NUDIX domain-containing protein [Deinococcus xianganensis]